MVVRFYTIIAFLFWLNPIMAQPTKIEKLIDKAYNIIEGDSAKPRNNYFVAVPIWGVYPETGWRLGLSNTYIFKSSATESTRPSLIRLNMQYTQLGQYSIRPFVDYFSRDNKYNIKLYFNHTYFNEYFYGIGNKTPSSLKELYYFKLSQFDVRVTQQIFKNTYIGLQIHTEQMFDMAYSNLNGLLNNGNIPGGKGSHTAGAGFVIAYDSRDKVFFPLKGSYVEISSLTNHKILSSDFNYNSITIDARKYFHLQKFNVVALQFYSRLNFGQAPFRQMATLGNDVYMRGYYNGRYRDNMLYAAQAELRQTIWGPLGIALFGGMGNVGSNINSLTQSIKPNCGIGIRGLALRREHVNIRIDYGLGEQGIKGFYFTMGEAF